MRSVIAIPLCIVGLIFGLSSSHRDAAAALDGRTDGNPTGDRESTVQVVRKHFLGEEGTCMRVVTAGVRTRNALDAPLTAGGTIDLPTGPLADQIIWAGLYWVILSDTEPTSQVQLNGSSVSSVQLPLTASPCWPEPFAFAYFAEVTSLVVPGSNEITGLDDSGTLASSPESEGASLVIVYEDPSMGACEIIIMDGNDLLEDSGQITDNPLPVTCGDGLPATLYFIGADGQTGIHGYAPDDQKWNDLPLGAGDDWDASDPAADGAEPDLSWDTDGWEIVTAAPNLASVSIPYVGGPGDCVNWIATVIEVNAGVCVPTPIESTTWGRIKSQYR